MTDQTSGTVSQVSQPWPAAQPRIRPGTRPRPSHAPLRLLPHRPAADPLPSGSSDDTAYELHCPVCDQVDWKYLFPVDERAVVRCAQCGLVHLQSDTHPGPTQLQADNPPRSDTSGASRTERLAAAAYCDLLERNLLLGARVLAAAPPRHPFLAEARRRGHRLDLLLDHEGTDSKEMPAVYDAAVIVFQLEQSWHPLDLLRRIHAAVRPGGLILIVTPSLDSRSARLLGNSWTAWRLENHFYFDRRTIRSALIRVGFDRVRAEDDRRSYALDHVADRARTFPHRWASAISSMLGLVPRRLARRIHVRLPASAMVVTARRATPRVRPLLSIIIPVYNERPTFEATFAEVAAKRLAGVDTEIIVVESNSTDGTRESVLRSAHQPGVKVILQDRPRGKGNAVREGLAHATGDFVMIQDADHEYDVNDYDALIEPLRLHQRAFVLGSRHTGDWKIRRFNNQPGLSTLFNVGHQIFLGLFNLLYGQRLTDPFTMFKVFRRDCLENVVLECDRFDFDYELVIKLIRNGHPPLEIPVNYHSRSFAEGKKVSAVRDPLTWLRALVKYRLGPGAPSHPLGPHTTSCSPERAEAALLPELEVLAAPRPTLVVL